MDDSKTPVPQDQDPPFLPLAVGEEVCGNNPELVIWKHPKTGMPYVRRRDTGHLDVLPPCKLEDLMPKGPPGEGAQVG
jgi:hypothetical protein